MKIDITLIFLMDLAPIQTVSGEINQEKYILKRVFNVFEIHHRVGKALASLGRNLPSDTIIRLVFISLLSETNFYDCKCLGLCDLRQALNAKSLLRQQRALPHSRSIENGAWCTAIQQIGCFLFLN